MSPFYLTFICSLEEGDELMCLALSFKEAVNFFDQFVNNHSPEDRITNVREYKKDVFITNGVLRQIVETLKAVE